MKQTKICLYSGFTAFATFILLLAGGLVTSTGSGLSVPDWPLSYGKFFPPMVGGIRFEHSHRLIAAFVGFCTFGLSFFLWRGEKRRFMRTLAILASVSILIQAILGGITVKFLLPTPISVTHACLGQTFFALLCLITLFLTREWKEAPLLPNESSGAFFRLCCTTTAFVYAQLVVGAVVRHTGGYGLVIHFFIAFFVVVHVFFLNYKMFRDKALTESFLVQTLLLDALVLCQIFLGLGTYFFKFLLEKSVEPRLAQVLFATAHQSTGALILANLSILCFRVQRLFKGKISSSTEFLELMKPRLTFAALATTLAGYLLASPLLADPTKILNTLLGAFLVGGGGSALNQFFERDADSRMMRTVGRPLPSKRLEPSHALWFGVAVSVLGLLELLLFVSPVTALIGTCIFLSYVFIYTPLKRITPLNTYVGAVPGALPLVLGWVAGGGSLGLETTLLFLLVFLWQLPHFYAIAWVYKDDYRRGGLRMMPETDTSGSGTGGQIVLFSALLFLASLLPFRIGISGHAYLAIATLSGAVFLGLAIRLQRRHMEGAKSFVTTSIVYLFILIISLVADKI